jgi:hypothetical protein
MGYATKYAYTLRQTPQGRFAVVYSPISGRAASKLRIRYESRRLDRAEAILKRFLEGWL